MVLWSAAVVGLAVVGHGGWSTHEWVQSHKFDGAGEFSGELGSVPRDIAIEVIVGLVIMILSAVAGLRESLSPIKLSDEYANANIMGRNQYAYLESRPNFQDLIERRKAYLNWRRSIATKDESPKTELNGETNKSAS